MPFKNTFNRFLTLNSDSQERPGSTYPGGQVNESHSVANPYVHEPGNGYRYVVYVAPGTLTINSTGDVDVLVIGGGGSGGKGYGINNPDPNPPFNPTRSYYCGGGGGAGGMLELFAVPFPTGDYDISVGSGGAAITGPEPVYTPGNFGAPSYVQRNPNDPDPSFTTLTAIGGGKGGGGGPAAGANPDSAGGNGGSGGGNGFGPPTGRWQSNGNNLLTNISPTHNPIPLLPQQVDPQGNDGGLALPVPGTSNFTSNSTNKAGGGGGAGGASPGQDGGVGRSVWTADTGLPTAYGVTHPDPGIGGRWFCGGGGGGGVFVAGTGGVGGGGTAAFADSTPPFSGTTSTPMPAARHNGGGGAGWSSSGYGGGNSSSSHGSDGIVIIRYSIG